jgi:hypothetical protein
MRLDLVQAIEDLRQRSLGRDDARSGLHLFRRSAAERELEDCGSGSLIRIEALDAVSRNAYLDSILHQEDHFGVRAYSVGDKQRRADGAAQDINSAGGSGEIVQRELARRRDLVTEDHESSHSDRV